MNLLLTKSEKCPIQPIGNKKPVEENKKIVTNY